MLSGKFGIDGRGGMDGIVKGPGMVIISPRVVVKQGDWRKATHAIVPCHTKKNVNNIPMW
jgi:hypothetical protein